MSAELFSAELERADASALAASPALGVELDGYDLAQVEPGSALADAFAYYVAQHGVVFARNQQLSPSQFSVFAQALGAVMHHGAYSELEDAPGVQILESTPQKPSKIEVWHSDMTFSRTPPTYTMLYADVLPEVGGDTLWASASAAWNHLSPSMRGLLEPLTATHDFRFGFRESLAEPGGPERLADAIAANPPCTHPVARVHPLTGAIALYVNRLFTTRLNELGKGESDALLPWLCDHVIREEHTVRLRWQPGTIAVWDNRVTQHKPVNDYHPAHRRMYRVTVADAQGIPTGSGDAPA